MICGHTSYPEMKRICKKKAKYEAIGMTRHLGYRCEDHKNCFISQVDLIPL